MKTPFFSPPKRLILQSLITLLTGLGCSYPLLLTLEIAAPFALCLCVCLAATAALSLLSCLPRLRMLGYPLLLLAIAAALLPYRDQPEAVSAALTLMLSGQPLALAAYARAITTVLALLMTAVGAALAQSEQAFFPIAFLMIMVLMAVSFLGANVSALSLLPLLLALLLCARAPGVTGRRILPPAALVLALTMALMPLAGSTLPEFEQLAARTRRMIDDYLFFTQPRTPFSMSATGWQPLGAERLGGPAAPSEDPVMQVETSGRTLLRATVKNEYTGLAWADTTSGRRYLFVSPRFAALRRDLFDQKRPDREIALPQSETITVTLRADSVSTLFLTQRFLSPRGEGVVAYYSPSTEVFATRSLLQGDRYAFSGRRLTAETPGVRSAVMAAAEDADPYLETVRGTYLQLPPSVSERTASLARQITASAACDFDRAAALCAHLQRAYAYTLGQSEPPVHQDFTDWFLFEEQQGYCTSFATAMTVMARCIGLPARYVEGYAAEPDADGVARVTQRHAHAWTEIYFPGFGWLTFDPTPGASGAPDSGNAGNEPQDEPGDDGGGGAITPSPEPTPSPTPSPTPEHSDPAVTPTPLITPVPTDRPDEPADEAQDNPQDEPRDEPQDDPQGKPQDDLPPWAAAILLLLLAVTLAAVRLLMTSPARAAARCRNPGDALLIWYAASKEALLQLGIVPNPGEAPATFLLRAQETLGGRPPLIQMGKALCVARYSGRRLKTGAAQKAEAIYRALLDQLSLRQKLRLYARRMLRGLRAE